MSTSQETEALWHALFDRCESGHTGTFFLACADNKSGQVVLNNGQVLGLTYAGDSGEQAVNALNESQGLKFSFSADLIFPLQETLLPDQAEALLRLLGLKDYRQQQAAPAEAETAELPRRSVRIYRGRVVQG